MNISRSEKVGFAHHKIHSEVLIDASPSMVWSVLTDTANYGDWAAFMVGIKGEVSDGAKITVQFQLDDEDDELTDVDHTISVVDGQSFYWSEKGHGGIRDNHHFRVEPTEAGKTRFVQSDEIRGGMTFWVGKSVAKMLVDGYLAFNTALKTEAERRV